MNLPGRTRQTAVAVVLLVGCAASIATTAPREECSKEASAAEVSSFYGAQDDEAGKTDWAQPKELTAHGYTVEDVTVSVPGCVAEAPTVPVYVRMVFEQDGTGAAPEDVFASFEVMDASGRTWRSLDPFVGEAQPAHDGIPASPASANLTFTLPLDVQPPVELLLGDLADDDLDRVVLDPAGTGEDG